MSVILIARNNILGGTSVICIYMYNVHVVICVTGVYLWI